MTESIPLIPLNLSPSKQNLDSPTTLSNIDETIARSRQIVQQSKQLTQRNNQRKALLQQRYKQIISPSEIVTTPSRASIGSPSSEYIKSKQHSQKLNQAQIKHLKALLSKKDLQIHQLKSEIENLKSQNNELKYQIKQAKQPNDYQIREKYSKKEIDQSQIHIENIQQKLRDMEQKYADQFLINQKLRENQYLEGEQNTQKIKVLEDRLLQNSIRYLDLQKRLEKTEKVIKKDLPFVRKEAKSSKTLKAKKKISVQNRRQISSRGPSQSSPHHIRRNN